MLESTISLTQAQLLGLVILVVWEFLWKGLAMWKAARRGDKGWFVAILVINSAAILPIFYLLFRKAPATKQGKS